METKQTFKTYDTVGVEVNFEYEVKSIDTKTTITGLFNPTKGTFKFNTLVPLDREVETQKLKIFALGLVEMIKVLEHDPRYLQHHNGDKNGEVAPNVAQD